MKLSDKDIQRRNEKWLIIPNGYDLNKMVQNHKSIAREEEAVKEMLERTGYTFFIRNSKDLQDIAVEVEATEGFHTNPNLVRKGESAELIKNFLSLFRTADEVPSDEQLNDSLQNLADTLIPSLEEQLQVLEQRISFYKDIARGKVDIDKVRGYLADNNDTREFRAFKARDTHEEALALSEKHAKDKRENSTGISMDFRKKD